MDVFNLPNTQNNTQVFYSNGSNNSWQTWVKPRNVRFVYMNLIGGGGGGSGGAVSTSANVNSGGGGGSSSITNGIFPANLLPDILYIQVGQGGIGGVGGVITGTTTSGLGSSGTLSYVSTLPNTNPMVVILASGNVAAGGGRSSTTPGLAGTAFVRTLGTSTGMLNYLGCVSTVAGQIGAAGTSTTLVNSITISLPVTGGAGGSSATSALPGGGIFGSEYIPTISGGTFPGGTGVSGVFSQLPSINSSVLLPTYFTGGAGGGAGNATNRFGGNGGNGSFGCGGGGGGNSVNASSVGGNGGRGGDGLVIITCF